MFHILERNLDTSGGSQAYSYVSSHKTLEEAQSHIQCYKESERNIFMATPYQPAPRKPLVYRTEAEWEAYSWKSDFIITVG